MTDDTKFKDELAASIRELLPSDTINLYVDHGKSQISIWRRISRNPLRIDTVAIFHVGSTQILGLYSTRQYANTTIKLLQALEVSLSPGAQSAIDRWSEGRTLASIEFDITPSDPSGVNWAEVTQAKRKEPK